jgi:hypothetical protein
MRSKRQQRIEFGCKSSSAVPRDQSHGFCSVDSSLTGNDTSDAAPASWTSPSSRGTINLTQEQRFIIKENVKDLDLPKAPKDAPETIGAAVDLRLGPTRASKRGGSRCRRGESVWVGSDRIHSSKSSRGKHMRAHARGEPVTVPRQGLVLPKKASEWGDKSLIVPALLFSRDSGDVSSALDYAERLARIVPADQNLAGLVQAFADG